MAPSSIVRPRRPAPLFVCRKCLKRSDDAKAIKTAMKRALKSETRGEAGADEKPARIVMTSCFGLCPKRSVVVTGDLCAARGEYLLVSAAEDVTSALRLLRTDQNKSS
jgi:predicted metal-binding protein